MEPNRFVILTLLGILLAGSAGPAPGQDRSSADKGRPAVEAEEAFLRTAPVITVSKQEGSGRANAWKVFLDNGQTASKAFFKYVDRRRPRPFPSSYRYELAAYALDKLLGTGLMPPTVERAIDGMPGSLQTFCEGVITEAVRKRRAIAPSDVTMLQQTFATIAILENLTYCPRDENDILIRTSDWKVWRIDYSEAFEPEAALIPDSIVTHCPRAVFGKLREVPDSEYRAKLGDCLNDEEIEALLARKRLIVDKLEALIKDKGEAAVLFDR
jgi:hypothetical protein